MSAFAGSFIPPTLKALPPGAFEALIATHGQRCSWLKSHTCPCVYAGSGANGQLPQLGSAQRNCTQCGGVGTYWDPPSIPAKVLITFMHVSPTPDEPGVRMNESYGMWQTAEPSLTVPYWNPTLPVGDPGQPTNIWQNASTNDQFVPVDSLIRYTAVLQVGVKENLPYQQNLQIEPQGAVTVWDPVSNAVVPVENYSSDGPTVRIGGYPVGTNYMVEFQASPIYVVFRAAGGLPHTRAFGGGMANEPKRWRLQSLDFWTRQRGVTQSAPGSVQVGGTARPYTVMVGSAKIGP
jgi:hypothetical protein